MSSGVAIQSCVYALKPGIPCDLIVEEWKDRIECWLGARDPFMVTCVTDAQAAATIMSANHVSAGISSLFMDVGQERASFLPSLCVGVCVCGCVGGCK